MRAAALPPCKAYDISLGTLRRVDDMKAFIVGLIAVSQPCIICNCATMHYFLNKCFCFSEVLFYQERLQCLKPSDLLLLLKTLHKLILHN